MVVVKVNGGLGNQMFQYAAGRALSLHNKTKMSLDTQFFYADIDRQNHEQNTLAKAFPRIRKLNIPVFNKIILEKKELSIERDLRHKYEVVRKMLGLLPSYKKVTEKKLLTYQDDFYNQNALILYLMGDWQNENYFINYENFIRNDFTFSEIISGSLNEEINESIFSTNSVSLHVRRGDYLSSQSHSPTSHEYYVSAIKLINERIYGPKYFVFSDDIEWCKTNLVLKNACYVNHNHGEKSYIDMQLMSNCKHNIIANSSFSWWGAWLNKNQSKIVVTPKIWLEKLSIPSSNIVPNAWNLV